MLQEKIQQFLWSEQPLPKIIVIYGPTACGKTNLSLEVAQYINSEIISADSRQIYSGLNIGTGKITQSEMRWIPHHMLDIIDPSVTFSMVDFADRALPIIMRILAEKKIPIICGGTGLYIDSTLYEMNYPDTPPDWEYRDILETIRKNEGNEILWQMLHEVDPLYADELLPENYRYVMRGLEVIRATWRSKRESKDTKIPRFSPLFLTPYDDQERAILYDRINHRVEKMFHDWLIDEVWYIIEKYTSHCPGLATIGYKEVVEYLEWKYTLTEALSLIQQHSRNYAKRQITWNKRYEWYSLSTSNK